MKSTTSSPVTVLMSWCKLSTLTPVISCYHCFHERPRGLEQMGPYLLEQVSPLFGRQRLDQVLFGGGQDALEANHDKIIDQVRVDIFGPAAHVLLLEAAHPLADGGFDFPQRFHDVLQPVRPRRREGTRALNVAELAGPNRPHSSHVIFIIQGSKKNFTCYFLLAQDNEFKRVDVVLIGLRSDRKRELSDD